MKRLSVIILAIVFPFVLSAKGGETEKDQAVIFIKTPKFTHPLIEKWVDEYTSLYPGTSIRWSDKSEETADLEFVQFDESPAGVVTWVSQYALLPVTSAANPFLDELNKKKLGKKEIKGLFFLDDPFADEASRKKNKYQDELTIYSGNNSYSASQVFARHLGYEVSDLKGKKIAGDDVFLLHAINKDKTGITVNNLAYLYDIESRHLKEDLVILPLDLKKEQQDVVASADIDRLLELLERQKIDLIPVQKIGFVAGSSADVGKPVHQFLTWVLTEGQQYNHTYGFLQLDEKTAKLSQYP